MPAIDQTRQQILYAAAHLFRDQGYATTTLRQIADATGIKAGSIYYHFASKDDMLLEVLEVGIRMVTDGVKERVSMLPADCPAHERIAAGIRGHLFGLLVHGDFTTANIRVYSQVPDAIKRKHRVTRHAYANYWDSLLEEARSRGELRTDIPISLIRPFILGSLNWTVEWYEPQEHGSVEQFAEHVTAIIFDGILASRHGSALSKTSAVRGRARQ
ncbi:MAG: TetR/AcrR family transcriptional regulator [Burkholderiaceae bacterium]|nr:TetR/AcrR family transcriptional regulator [Burkholderiaceae bacterium]